MDWSAPNSGFVAAAYALSFAIIAALVVYVLLRDRASRRDSEALEKKRPS